MEWLDDMIAHSPAVLAEMFTCVKIGLALTLMARSWARCSLSSAASVTRR